MNKAKIATACIAITVATYSCQHEAWATEGCSKGQCLRKMCQKIFGAKDKSLVYLCSAEKVYFNEDTAQKMKYVDHMGNALVKAARAPKGYKEGITVPIENQVN